MDTDDLVMRAEKTDVEMPTQITTGRLVLRPFRSDDVEDALAYRDDVEFARFLPHIPQPFTRADAEAFVATNMTEPWDQSPTFAVVLEGRVIGTVNFEVDACASSRDTLSPRLRLASPRLHSPAIRHGACSSGRRPRPLPPGGDHGIAKELMMAGRKKGLPIPPHDSERAFAVVVEQLRGDFKVFGEALGGVREEVGGLREELGGLRQQMTDGFERVDRELGEVKRDLGEVKRDLGEVKRDLGEVKRRAR